MNEASMLEAIAAEPRNLQLRLIYADWLEEQGDPRAEYIRLEQPLAPARAAGAVFARLAAKAGLPAPRLPAAVRAAARDARASLARLDDQPEA